MGTSIIYSKGGAAASTVQNMAATGSVTAWNSVVTQSSAGATTVTLPAALAAGIGTSVTVRNTGTGVITVAPFAGNTLSGQTSIGAGGAVTYTVTAAGTVVTSHDVTPASGSTPIVSVLGSFDTGDIGGGTTGAMTVAGQVISATKTNADGGSKFDVTIPNMGNTTYALWIYTEGLGASPWDSATTSLVVGYNKTATTFSIYMKADDEVFLAGPQNIRVNVYAMSSLPTATTAVVNASLVPVTTDGLFTAPTDAQVPSALAVKTYVDENTKAPNVVLFSANGTYTPSAGMKWVEVEMVGGGGGGGGAVATTAALPVSVGGSAGAGGYIRAILTATQIGASQAVTVGAAGTAGAAGGAGGTGGASSLGALLSCTGGGGGVAPAASAGVALALGGAGGAFTVTVGSLVAARQGDSAAVSMAVVSGTAIGMTTANGASSPFGRGGRGVALNSTTATLSAGLNGSASAGPGAGASGSVNAGTAAAARAGVAGSLGRVVITEFF